MFSGQSAEPAVSVIVATVEAERSIVECLRSLKAARGGSAAELIVVDGSNDTTADLVHRIFPDVALIRMRAGTLAPRLWSAGLAVAKGRNVALMTGHSKVPYNWLDALGSALGPGVSGSGGPVALSAASSLLDAAIYFLRYSAFMPGGNAGATSTREIAADNAMYRGDILRRHSRSFDDGFWEVDFHHRIRAEGEALAMVPGARLEFGRSFPLMAISRQRFAHGRHFGRWRVRNTKVTRLRTFVAAPVVPFVLMARIAGRVFRSGGDALRFAAASPLILWLSICWAAGEARGAAEA